MKYVFSLILFITISLCPNSLATDSDYDYSSDSYLDNYLGDEILQEISERENSISGRTQENRKSERKKRKEKHKKTKKKKQNKPTTVANIDNEIIKKYKNTLKQLIEVSDQWGASAFQSKLSKIKQRCQRAFIKELQTHGYTNRSDENNEMHFAVVFKNLMNTIYEVEKEYVKDQEIDFNLEFDDDLSDDTSSDLENSEKHTYKTTIINLLMRRNEAVDLDKKIQTLIEYGADKNLNPAFSNSVRMENQSEYPLSIALWELSNEKDHYPNTPNIKNSVLKVLTNDDITYAFNDLVHDSGEEPLMTLTKSLITANNYEYIFKSLIDSNDFETFDLILTYLEKSGEFIIQEFEDQLSQVTDQIWCPTLENILKEMRDIRHRASTNYVDENNVSTQKDNIKELLNSKKFRDHIKNSNAETRFGRWFQERLDKNYESDFKRIANDIDRYRLNSEIYGNEFHDLTKSWVQLANFRNRVAIHLNNFAMAASNDVNKSNIIKLIRYTNIHNENNGVGIANEVFRELHEFGGKDLIFLRTNKYGWTPLIYAMMRKASEGIQLYLRQAPNEISKVDGLDNNVLHVAFPLPFEFFKSEIEDSNNVLQLIGSQSGNKNAEEKTFEAIKAILTERRIGDDLKVEALKQMSASNYTPVSLAANMGFLDIYTYMKDKLKENGEWNRDEHAHLDTHIEEIALIGAKNHLENNKEELDKEQARRLKRKIKRLERNIKKIEKNSLNDLYCPEDEETEKILQQIIEPVEEIFANLEQQDSTQRSQAPYSDALEAAIEMMNNPPKVKVMVEATRTVTGKKPIEVEVKKDENKNTNWFKKVNRKFKKNILNRHVNEEKEYQTHFERYSHEEIYEKPEWQKTKLHGMKKARSNVKISYLIPIVEMVMRHFLNHHKHPRKLSFKATYQAITDNQMMDFFKSRFNVVVEKKMQELIMQILEQADRLDEREFIEEEEHNRFDIIDNGFNNQIDLNEFYFGEESSLEDSDVI